ncbi:MAG: hypothetical protein IKA33_02085, partial [Candidatus Methanomethylophilaceae archaeon]|nr:hypothetical protein [Candidatus Methanomethylophilaceae archaeon]
MEAEYALDTQDAADALEAKMQSAMVFTLATHLKISTGVSFEIPAHIVVELNNGFGIYVGNDAITTTAAETELIIYGKVTGTGIIKVGEGANLYLDGADVRVNIDADEDAYISVTNAKKMSVSGNQTADLGVGYGNTLVLSDLTVPAGKSIDAYGTVVIEGIANIDGAADVNGSVKVYNANGNAAFNVAAGADVDVAGTMDVLVGKNKAQNTLTIEDVPTKDKQKGKMNFVVTGTLNITGTLDGAVYDMGTVAFNGTAVGSNAKIFIFDGMTITIASVNGQLTVEDKIDITDFITNEKASNSNNVVLNNVKNVTVSTEVTETVKGNASKQKIRYYTLNMTVSGAVTSIDDTVTTANYANISINNAGASEGWADAKVDDRSITIGDITAGKKVGVNIAAVKATVAGIITIAAEGSKIVNSSTVAVDVDGAIVIVDKEAKKTDCTIGLLNAAAYEVEDKTGTAPFDTYYYT